MKADAPSDIGEQIDLAIRHELWRRGELSWKLHSAQLDIDTTVRKTKSKQILLLISRQWGKSYWALIYALAFCLKNPGSIVRIVAPGKTQAMDIINDNLDPIIQDAPPGLIKKRKSEYRWTVGKSSLRIGILKRAHANTMRGGNAKLIIIEEGCFVPSEDYRYAVKSVIGPQLLRSKGQLVHVTTPSEEEPEHFVHMNVLPQCQLTDSFFSKTIYDNPQLDEEAINQAIEFCGGVDTDDFQREYMARIIRSKTSLCVPEYGAHHVADLPVPAFAKWTLSIDLGGVKDKTCAVLGYFDFERQIDVIWDEAVFERNTDTGTIIKGLLQLEERLKEAHPDVVFNRIADASGQTHVDFRKETYTVTLPFKQDWSASIASTRLLFTKNKIAIHPRCKHLIATLVSARYNKQRTDFARVEGIGHCDSLAALMYWNRSVDRITNPFPLIMPGENQIIRRKDTGKNAFAKALTSPKKKRAA